MFIAWICNESSIALLFDYVHNPIYREAPRKDKQFTSSDERFYIDLRMSKGHTKEFERVNRNDSELVRLPNGRTFYARYKRTHKLTSKQKVRKSL